MRRATRLLVLLTLAAIAVPLVPFLLFGTRLDRLVAHWLDPMPAPPVLAMLEVGVLAVDILLPVPSSMVATLGGAELGLALGTAYDVRFPDLLRQCLAHVHSLGNGVRVTSKEGRPDPGIGPSGETVVSLA